MVLVVLWPLVSYNVRTGRRHKTRQANVWTRSGRSRANRGSFTRHRNGSSAVRFYDMYTNCILVVPLCILYPSIDS